MLVFTSASLSIYTYIASTFMCVSISVSISRSIHIYIQRIFLLCRAVRLRSVLRFWRKYVACNLDSTPFASLVVMLYVRSSGPAEPRNPVVSRLLSRGSATETAFSTTCAAIHSSRLEHPSV